MGSASEQSAPLVSGDAGRPADRAGRSSRLSDYDYSLPRELIAQHPADPRDSSRLMVVDRATGKIAHHIFRDLPDYLRASDVLVLNDTRVIPARLRGRKGTGGQVEVLLLRPLGAAAPEQRGGRTGPAAVEITRHEIWEALVRPGRRLRTGMPLIFPGNSRAVVGDRTAEGTRAIIFESDRSVLEILREAGEMPLPPYITELLAEAESYQTVYARREGAVAAPTAGLHFTPGLLASTEALGVRVVTLTLHIGLGTFRAVQAEEIRRHRMDPEYFEISAAAAAAINAARRAGGRVVVVGTSAVRALESAVDEDGRVCARCAWTDLFVTPGHRFRATDALVTNFHLPRTTLLILVSAFAGRDLILRAYREAVEARYRFYSFGDAMLLL
ncbi:MAG: tRNA preQ1(34) S-adenosylmethionine ribosyltransferase-isomerase QueA [Armatimonadetes bacterium]|nr:tRNA preQ1(34) S-adenosylmethionine ribosyltransferase-isomerase QueA [Armatimonadota bacterium]